LEIEQQKLEREIDKEEKKIEDLNLLLKDQQ
jgi:hypothetical protein